MRNWRLTIVRVGRARLGLAALGAVAVVLAAVLGAALLGSVGLLLLLGLLQVTTLVTLVWVRVGGGRAVRQDLQRVERRLVGLQHGQDQRLQELETTVRQLLMNSSPTFARAEKLRSSGELGAATEEYEAILAADPTSPSARIGLIEALLGDGRHDDARHHARLLPHPADATFGLHPNALRADAIRLRRELDVDPPGARAIATETQRQLDAGDVHRARSLAELGLRHHPGNVRIGDRLVSALDATGEVSEGLRLAVDTARRRVELLADARPKVEDLSLTRGTRVLVSGFFYSGSGAVIDHLRGFPGVVKWGPSGEMRLIKFPGGLADLAARYDAARRLEAQDLLDLYLHIVGRKTVGHGKGVYSTWGMVNRNSRRLLRSDRARGYLQRCIEGFLDLHARQDGISARQLLEWARTTTQQALDAAATDTQASMLVVDQAVTAMRLTDARFVPPSTFVVVHRDPRDQFTEVSEVLARKPGRDQGARTPEGFAERYRREREQATQLFPALESSYGHRFLALSFEDFVVDHVRTAERLHDVLGLDPAHLEERRFDPMVSIANVGKHVLRLDHEDSARLRDLLPEYLHPAADEPHEDGSRHA